MLSFNIDTELEAVFRSHSHIRIAETVASLHRDQVIC